MLRCRVQRHTNMCKETKKKKKQSIITIITEMDGHFTFNKAEKKKKELSFVLTFFFFVFFCVCKHCRQTRVTRSWTSQQHMTTQR